VPLLKDLYLTKKNANPHHYAQILAKIGKDGVPALATGFKDDRPEVRQAASQALQQVGADAVGILVDALGDKNVEVRRLAAQTLWPMRIGDKSVVIALAFALADEDDQVRQTCMQAIAQLGIQAKLAAPKVKEALTDMNQNVRTQAYYFLQQINEDPAPTLIKGLESKNDKVRINTAALMVGVNFKADAAFPVLVEGLKNEDLGLKMQAAFTLAQRQQHKDKVLPIFLDGLKHKSAGVRLQGVQGISMFGNGASAYAVDLAKVLSDPDNNVRQNAVYALQNVRGTPEAVIPILTATYKDGNADARRTVLQVVFIYADKSMDIVIDGLKDKDANVRQQAIWALQNVRGTPEKMVPILTTIYKDGDASIKRSILSIAYIYGAKAKDLVMDGLKDKDNTVRQQAVFTLQNLQGDLTEALPTIMELMKDKELNINRNQLVWLLSRTGEAGAPHLGELLKDKDLNVRFQAAQFLRNLGPKGAAKAMPAIKEAMTDSHPNIRFNCMYLVAAAGGDGPDELAKLFADSKDGGVRATALQALVSANQKKAALPLLKSAMKGDVQLRQMAVNLLGNFGQDSAEGFDAFTQALKDEALQIRVSAGYLGSYYGQKSHAPLEEALKSTKDSNFRQAIMQSLQNSNYKAKSGVAPLIECLKDANPTVKVFACNLLGNIGSDAVDALPALREAAKDSNAQVQQSANAAVRRIEPKDKDR
jgi:HEAT repeat protein